MTRLLFTGQQAKVNWLTHWSDLESQPPHVQLPGWSTWAASVDGGGKMARHRRRNPGGLLSKTEDGELQESTDTVSVWTVGVSQGETVLMLTLVTGHCCYNYDSLQIQRVSGHQG